MKKFRPNIREEVAEKVYDRKSNDWNAVRDYSMKERERVKEGHRK